jgi:molybdopterin/thiamine biosynthesis adenylyltransferase
MLCVDNERTRELVINYAHKHNKDFIDLRANGRRIFVMPKAPTLEDNMKFVDSNDKVEYSCQEKDDLENDRIQLGNKIVALMGVQALMNCQRGYPNKIMMMVI